MKILNVVGTRPNFVKIAPLHRTFLAYPSIESKLIHTGQHYDFLLNEIFFQQLNLPEPDYYLNVGPGTPAQQTDRILQKIKPVLLAEQPDWVLVVGDVTSTYACALAAFGAGIRVAHVEAGLRSGDWLMPEERNRKHTDHLADLLFVTEQAGLDNLRREGVSPRKIHFVGNVMIDSLIRCHQQANQLNMAGQIGLAPKEYVLMTIHRPSNVDTEAGLRRILQIVEEVAQQRIVLFVAHPRTRTKLIENDLLDRFTSLSNVRLLKPQGYLEFLNLMEQAAAVITDSGGVQEETTYLGVPCLTLRDSTERPVTIELGTNQLVADLAPQTVRDKLIEILTGKVKAGQIPPLWDGQTAGRIAEIMSRT